MGIFYSEHEPPFTGRVIPYHKQNAAKHFLNHYRNLLTLQFMIKNVRDAREKCELERELRICQRKLEHWKRHPNYTAELRTVVEPGIQELKAQWR